MTERITTNSDRTVYACPRCDSAGKLERRAGNGNATIDPGKPFICRACSTGFQYVIERPREHAAGSQQQRLSTSRATHRELDAMGPDDAGLSPIGVRGGAD